MSKALKISVINTVALLFCFCSVVSLSQNNLWYITKGLGTDEVAWAVDVDSAGNIYWAIEEKDQWPFWYYNINLCKISPDGQEILQSASWGNEFNDLAFKATVSGSNIYLSGRIDSTGNPVSGDALVACFNAINGNFNWSYTYNPVPDYGYEEIDGLMVQPDGIYLSGWTQKQGANDMDFLIQKISLSGEHVWTTTYDYDSLGKFDGANGHCAMDDNFLYVAGHVNRTNVGSLDGDAALVCFSRSDGSEQWHVTWGGSLYDDALGMTMSADSMLYVVGYTGSFGNGSQVYLNKYSRNGVLQWSRIWGGPGTEDCRSAVADGDSMIYVAGTTGSYGNGGKDVFILKYDSAGTLVDSLFWGGAYDETAKDVERYGEYLYITGETKSFGNGQINGDHKTDGLLLKINGRKMLSPDTAITVTSETQISERKIAVYPNPSNDELQITIYDLQFQKAELKIFNLLGEEVLSSHISHLTSLVSLDFPCGIYFLKITSGDFSVVQKIIIQK